MFFMEKMFEETQGLLIESRQYVKDCLSRDMKDAIPMDRLKVSCEAMRVTARLTQVMAWLMLRKAVEAHELTEEEILSPHFQVLHGDNCMSNESAENEDLPFILRELLARSYDLYMRVKRLDEAARRPKRRGTPLMRLRVVSDDTTHQPSGH